MDVVLGLDVGTTSAKAAIFDASGRMCGQGEHGYALDEPEPGAAVFEDVTPMLDAAVAAMADAVRGAGSSCDVRAISVSTAMHGLCALDADGGQLSPLMTWADTRAAPAAEELRASHPELHARTGTPLHPMSPLVKLRWLRGRVEGAARWGGVKELVLLRLTGAWAVDVSVGSGTGMMDLRTQRWDPEALELAGVREEQLAPLVGTTDAVGDGLTAEVAAATGLPAGLTVIAGAGDGPLANLGVGAVEPGVAACSIGTSGALRLVVEKPVIDRAGRVFCYALTPGRWVIGGAINNGGNVLQWAGDALAPELGEHHEAELLAAAASVPPGSEGLVMLPYLQSERAPHWSALPLGAYVGLTHVHRRGHLVRAAIEGVCQQLALVLASMRDAGNEVREIRATGGFARSELWKQMLADALGMRITFPSSAQGTAFGAALLAMPGLGMVESIDRAAELVAMGDAVEPDPAAATVYAKQLELFEQLYTDLAPAFRVLRGA